MSGKSNKTVLVAQIKIRPSRMVAIWVGFATLPSPCRLSSLSSLILLSAGDIFAFASRRQVHDGSKTLDVDDMNALVSSRMAITTNVKSPDHKVSSISKSPSNRPTRSQELPCEDMFSRKASADLPSEPSNILQQDSWFADGTYNGRSHCNIFAHDSENLDTPDAKRKKESQIKELKGRLTNTVTVEAVLMKASGDDEEFVEDLGKQVAQQMYITLIIGDWVGALECILALRHLNPEDIGTALEYKDEEGNTLMHRAVMSADSPDLETKSNGEASQGQKRGLKFEDNSNQVHREKIVERLFMMDQSLLLQQNKKGDTPLECCASNIMREHIRMLVRKKHVEKQSQGSTIGKFESIQGMRCSML